MRIQTVPANFVDVLVVRTTAPIRESLRQLLEVHGYRSTEAREGRQAWSLMCAEPSCYLLLDAAVVSALTKGEAEQLLDWLENHICTGMPVSVEEDGFAVRCVCLPGLRLLLEKGTIPACCLEI
jgi:DNA-binding NtrC family response regulator